MENTKLIVSSTPHIRSKDSIQSIMRDVLIALTPAALMGIWYFGIKALLIIAVSIASSIFFEAAFQKITKKSITITDLSAAVTGLLLAMNLPVEIPFYLPIVGAFFAIIVSKQLFGGLGQNFINPALAARAFLLASYPTPMTNFTSPTGLFANSDTVAKATSLADAVSNATPLSRLNEGAFIPEISDYIDALSGNIGGCIGETCAIALIIGGIYLLVRRVISWRIPVTYILTVFILSWFFGRTPLYELLIGGLMLGAFFMATDYSSSPVTPLGQLIMGFGCGVLTALIRSYGSYPEGVSYSILLMNLAVPLIDRYTKPKIFGEVKKNDK